MIFFLFFVFLLSKSDDIDSDDLSGGMKLEPIVIEGLKDEEEEENEEEKEPIHVKTAEKIASILSFMKKGQISSFLTSLESFPTFFIDR